MSTKDKQTPVERGVNPQAGGRPAPAADRGGKAPARGGSASESVAEFIAHMSATAPSSGTERGRLIFAMDATMSRQPTWDMALSLQSEMFRAVKDVGGLDVQLVFFRGTAECRASRWVSDPEALAGLMRQVSCQGGLTQLGRVIGHASAEARARKINALVYVGDAMEEAIDPLCAKAGELGLLGVPVFLFQEGHDPLATTAFREIARLTKGATCRFDAGSAAQLRALLTAVAVYASGGRKALQALSRRSDGEGARLLIGQMKSGG